MGGIDWIVGLDTSTKIALVSLIISVLSPVAIILWERRNKKIEKIEDSIIELKKELYPKLVKNLKEDSEKFLNEENTGLRLESGHIYEEIVNLKKDETIVKLKYNPEIYNLCDHIIFHIVGLIEHYNEARDSYEVRLKSFWLDHLKNKAKDIAHIKTDLFEEIQISMGRENYELAKTRYMKELTKIREIYKEENLPNESDYDRLVEINKSLLANIYIQKENAEWHIKTNIIEGLIPLLTEEIGSLTK